MRQFEYNLLSNNWIPVVKLDGTPYLVSLRDVLVDAVQYRNLSASLPHANAALLRLLLAVLFRVFGPIDRERWAQIYRDGSFDAQSLDAYFARWQTRFDLFDPEYPFFQYRHPQVSEKPAQALLQMIGGGDTFTLFDHVMDEVSFVLTPAQASLLLLTTQSFALAGLCHPQLKLVYTDAACSRAAVFVVEGKNLFQTLMFNLVGYRSGVTPYPGRRGTADRPVWEADDPYQPERFTPLGYVDYLTWPNRRIRLIPEQQNGQTVIARITSAPGLVLAAEVHNAMYHYRIVKGAKEGQNTLKMLRFTEGRALWRDSYALLNMGDEVEPPLAINWMRELVSEGILSNQRLQMAAYGMSTEPGKAKVNFYRSERFELEDSLLCNQELVNVLGTALDQAESLRRELWSSTSRLAKAVLSFNIDQPEGHQPDPKDAQNLLEHWNTEGLYWSRLEAPFHVFMNRLPVDPAAALDDWQKELRQSALTAFRKTANSLGTGQKALKAVASTQGWIFMGIRRVLDPQK